MRFLKVSAISFLIVVFSLLALADLSIEQKTTTGGMMGQPAQTHIQKIWITKNQVCFDNTAMGQKMIFDAAKNKLIIINLNQKTYSEVAPQKYKEMTSGMMAMMGDQSGAPQFTIKKTGKKRTIGSWKCYQVIMAPKAGKGATIEMWVTKQIKYEKAMYDKYTEIFSTNMLSDETIDQWKKIDGFPVLTITHMTMGQMKIESKTEVTSVSYKPIPKKVFSVPAGFKKVPLKMPQMP